MVGLAVGRALALAGREVIVLEAADAIGTETSSRNSEVIHAGIYYPRGSLKARTCVAGRQLLYAYLAERGLPYRQCGKLIVATSAEEDAKLDAIRAQAAGNGVADLCRLDARAALALEPELAVTSALLSPSTGILDSHAYMLSLQGECEDAGGVLVFGSPVLAGRARPWGLEIDVGGADPITLACRVLVNCAGLAAPRLASRIAGLPPARVPRAYFAKGNYFTLTGRSPFRHLVYPVPVAGGLGVHLTLDLAGAARFGPDVEWIEHIDYGVDPVRGELFYAAIRRYWPGLPDRALAPGYSGIRPKLSPKGAPADDFIVEGPREHGVAGLVNLFGIESPGLTASLALAGIVLERLEQS